MIHILKFKSKFRQILQVMGIPRPPPQISGAISGGPGTVFTTADGKITEYPPRGFALKRTRLNVACAILLKYRSYGVGDAIKQTGKNGRTTRGGARQVLSTVPYYCCPSVLYGLPCWVRRTAGTGCLFRRHRGRRGNPPWACDWRCSARSSTCPSSSPLLLAP